MGAAAGSKIFNRTLTSWAIFWGPRDARRRQAPLPALALHESGASFSTIVDQRPGDFFVSLLEGVEVEEDMLTFTSLPAEWNLDEGPGRMRSDSAKSTRFTTTCSRGPDRPLVTENLVGGEEGISDAGVSVARLIPNRFLFLEATGQVFRGDSGETLFRSSERSDLGYVGHLRGYQDLSESTNV